MKTVAVVGGGPSGLCAIRHCILNNFQVIAFEQNNDIGGQWNTTGAVGKNKFGIEAHSSIYENLVTNLPKEIMAFPDYPYDESIRESFLTPDKVLNYFHSYADTFQLRDHIKFEHEVTRVRPLSNSDTWEVIVKDLVCDKFKTFTFDHVFICTGIFTPMTPKFEGRESFKGQVLHSHDYRNTKMFVGERILVVGTGPSALDIVLQIGEVSEKVFWVHKMRTKFGRDLNIELPKNAVEKAAISKITPSGAEFIDGSFESFSIIIYATGFDFSFPFLSVDSEISVDDKKIYPLYKHCININKPSLAFIGLPFISLAMPMFDIQIRFCLQFWSGRKALPIKEKMLAETNQDLERRRLRGLSNHNAHCLGLKLQSEYYVELAEAAEIEPLKPVFGNAYDDVLDKLFENYLTFRKYNYRLLNDTDFDCTFKTIGE